MIAVYAGTISANAAVGQNRQYNTFTRQLAPAQLVTADMEQSFFYLTERGAGET
jgi:hypothetical protein